MGPRTDDFTDADARALVEEVNREAEKLVAMGGGKEKEPEERPSPTFSDPLRLVGREPPRRDTAKKRDPRKSKRKRKAARRARR